MTGTLTTSRNDTNMCYRTDINILQDIVLIDANTDTLPYICTEW
jgi:hypothetical protein